MARSTEGRGSRSSRAQRSRASGLPGSEHPLERQLAEWQRFADVADAMRAPVRVVVVRIVERAGSRAVVTFFRHRDDPNLLFAYRCLPPGADPYERVWVAEELATGGLDRLVQRTPPVVDVDWVVWLELPDLR